MNALEPLVLRVRTLGERIDRLSLRERALVFGGAIVLAYVAWQSLLMDPLAARASAAEQRLVDVGSRLQAVDATLAGGDPRAQALVRRRALSDRLDALDATLRDEASGYVPADRMTEMLRDVLDRQHGLRLVSLRNLPVEALMLPAAPAAADAAAGSGTPAANGGAAAVAAPNPGGATSATANAAAGAAPATQGPFVHPVEVVVEGDYAAIVAYLQALERLPWRVQWRRLDLEAGEYPVNRVRIELGTLSLSREWLSV